MKSKLCTIVISLLIVLSFSACTSEKHEMRWNFIPATATFLGNFPGKEKLSINSDNSNIVAASRHPGVLYLLQDLKSLEKIPLFDEENRIKDICYADEIWVITSDDQTLSYDPGTQSWTLHPELSGSNKCYVTPDSRLILWNARELYIYDSQWLTITISSRSSPIITRDIKGTLWLLATNPANPAELYKLDKNGLSFVKSFDIPNAVQLFVSSTGGIWIITQEQIYIWRPTDANMPPESIMDFSEFQPFAFWIYEDSTGTIWIVTRNDIWAYTGTKFEKIDLPVKELFFEEAISAAAFDYQKDRLYTATEDGIYYLDVLDPSVQGGE